MSNAQGSPQSQLSPRARLTGEPIVVGIDVGSTTVKAVVVDPADAGNPLVATTSATRRGRPRTCWSCWSRIGDEFDDIPARARPRVHHRLGRRPAVRAARRASSCRRSTPSRWRSRPAPRRRQRRRARRPGREDHHLQARTRRPASKRAIASMNDKCASGTGATIDKCMIKVGMPPRRSASCSGIRRSCTTSRPSAASSPRPTSSTW